MISVHYYECYCTLLRGGRFFSGHNVNATKVRGRGQKLKTEAKWLRGQGRGAEARGYEAETEAIILALRAVWP